MAYRPVDDIQHVAGSITEAYQLNPYFSDRIWRDETAANQISWFTPNTFSGSLPQPSTSFFSYFMQMPYVHQMERRHAKHNNKPGLVYGQPP